MAHAADDLQFDYDGSLALARRLYALGDALNTLMSKRLSLAESAIVQWSGKKETEFVGRMNDEQGSGSGFVQSLHVEANQWASAWAQAVTQQNKISYQRERERRRNDRSFLESAGDFLFGGGGDDGLKEPAPVSVPSAPGFAPTGSLVHY